MRARFAQWHEWFHDRLSDRFVRWAPTLAGVLVLSTGVYVGKAAVVGVGLVGTLFCIGRAMRQRSCGSPRSHSLIPLTPEADPPPQTPRYDGAPNDLGMLIEEMLSHGRYALLLRPQIVGNLSGNQTERTHRALADGMAIVPAGEVMLGESEEVAPDGRYSDEEVERNRLSRVAVEDYFLDRYPVTNRQFYQFVASGGYEQLSLWEPSILAAVLGAPGPRFWRDGRYPRGADDYPVVGISWYEAAAYARWAGKRLPSDAEWVKASSWPVPVATGIWQQRKYPWGNAMERSRANLWGAGPGGTVPVDEFRDGVSAGGVYQLIGNVWEWTTGDFGYDDLDGPLLGDPSSSAVMKSIHGGSFDTYFDAQATCQFRSGEHPLGRKHNIGFRCALSACDVFARPDPIEQPEAIESTVPYEDAVSETELQPEEVGV
jgi:iron(II)-dependent oxidoreductase